MSTDRVEIRRAQSSDASEMARLAAELGYPMPPEEMRRRLERLLSDARHYVVVAAIGSERLSGWTHVEHRSSLEGGERAELMGLVVDTTARRSGIGSQLVDAAENWALSKSLQELTVRSNTARELSHSFYLALGYRRIKAQHVYSKPLSPRHRLA